MTIRFTIALLLWLGFATAANSAYTPCVLCIDRASPAMLAAMELRLYEGPTVDDYISVRVGDAPILLDRIDDSKPIVLYIHGFLDGPDSPSSQGMVQAYLARRDHNILILDWSNIADNINAPYVARSVEGVGYTLAESFNELYALGLNPSGLHIVGHSLGAQVSGYFGRYVDFPVPRITGLDPAGPGFYFLMEHLASGDAIFVVIIHTDQGVLGIALQTGDVDFYPNGGFNVQPGCTIAPLFSDICSHYRAVYYYIESVTCENCFIGISCDSELEFENGLCNANPTTVMGYGTPSNARQRYYLQTNSESPYGRGEDGTRYDEVIAVESLVQTSLPQSFIIGQFF